MSPSKSAGLPGVGHSDVPQHRQLQFCLEKQLTHCRFSPAVESGSDFEVIDNKMVFDVLPDEKTYLMEVY